jgi:cellulose synthase/poly-beta-1,6-N-acetylglucosamine synthase-like glycosyltransferase
MPKPLVSVVIDAYNQEHYIEQAIVSVLGQGFSPSDLQVIVVDDGSTDRTAEIARKFEPSVRLIRKANGGQASALNAGIAQVNAEIVSFLDGDDWWATEKLKCVVEAFSKNPGIAAVGHGYFEVVHNSPPAEMFVAAKTLFIDLSSTEAARIANLARMLLGSSRLSVRREVLRRIGPIPTELVTVADAPILTLPLALGGAIILDKPLCYYRLHSPEDRASAAGDHTGPRDYHHEYSRARDYDRYRFLIPFLSRCLQELGVAPEIIAAFFDADNLGLDRLQLQREGGQRLKTLRTEMRASRSEYRSSTIGYKLFKVLIASLALTLPPQRFYDLRDWYSRHKGMHRLRRAFAQAEPIVPRSLFQRRPVLPTQNL